MSEDAKLFFPNYSGYLLDVRLERRSQQLWKMLSEQPGSSIRKISANNSEQKAYYRLLNNERLKEEHFINEASSRAKSLANGRDLLCIQDTCEINLGKHKGRLKEDSGLGRSDKGQTGHCFKVHPGLVMDANTFSPLGFSHIKIFHRPEDKPDKYERDYKKQAIEEKESYKWIEVASKSKEILESANSVTFIEDREGDIFEQFARIPDEKFHLLIRSRANRKTKSGNLYSDIQSQPIAGNYQVEIPTDNRKKQFKRTAHIALRFGPCDLMRPRYLKRDKCPESVKVYFVSVRETHRKSKPINWTLLTTQKVNTYDQALKMVDFYSARWYIEQLFRLLKKQGFGIEETELESGWAIRKLIVMQMTALLKILQMNIAYAHPEEGQPIAEVFNEQQIQILKLLNDTMQGKTSKLQNHFNPNRTAWAAWIVGRLGGWKGYKSQGPPGVIVLKRGIDRLGYIMEGVELGKDVYTR